MTRCPPRHGDRPGSERPDTGFRPAPSPPRRADPDLAPVMPAARHRGEYARRLLRLADRAAAAAAEVLALAAPVGCVCCGAEDTALCGACARQIRLLTFTPFRAEGQAPALMDMDGTVILPVVAAGVYRGELAQAVLSFKSHGQGRIAEALAKGLGRALTAAAGPRQDLCLVPVPTGSGAFRRRGFSPVHLLVTRLGSRGPAGPTVVDALRKTSPAGPAFRPAALSGGQKGLGRGDRARRVRGSMRAKAGPAAPDIRGRPCIIVDDVLTTGATLAEAARALGEAGGLVCGAVVLAATRPPGRPVPAPPATVHDEQKK